MSAISDGPGIGSKDIDDPGNAGALGGLPGAVPGQMGPGGVMVGGAVVGADGQTIINAGLDAK